MESSKSDLRLLRLSEVAKKLGVCRVTLYSKIKEGVFPVPVGVGTRSVAWPNYEVDEMIKAIIAGYTDKQLAERAQQMVIDRQKIESL